MALQELNQEAVQPTIQALLEFLDRDDVMIPVHMAEQMTSGKSLLRALVSGQIVLAQKQQEQPAPVEAEVEEAA